ncbi:MAG: hypothetical protein COB67_06655 [SAR324 cluster bacterium]|uniref:histidine kinase n=1 Tax=SAR324 cluster bacterium TaxID=2024889 RepID=A0A2A4T5B5_9DELT|nr:MAG: hypothetical protein COB67_06655 [SAR324 cluster bacterium]
MNTPRVLVIDDEAAILRVYRRILSCSRVRQQQRDDLGALAQELFKTSPLNSSVNYRLITAQQGMEAVKIVQEGKEQNDPIAVAFVDIRMPPGIDGLETARLLVEIDPKIEIVFVTAFSDQSRKKIKETLKRQHFFYIQKPFDKLEVRQMTDSLLFRWQLARDREELDQDKEVFISNMTHEIRHPIQVILGACDTLLNYEMEDTRRNQFIRDIETETKRLYTLTKNLNILKQNQKITQKFHLEGIHLFPLIDHAHRLLRKDAEKKGLLLELKKTTERDFILGNSDALIQVLINLIVNAINYTTAGSILTSVSEEEQQLIVQIQDTGVGVLPEEQTSIFKKFYRVKEQAVKVRGHGLGLSICQEIILAHGSMIQLQSRIGEGSCFSFALPYSIN